MKLNKKIMSGCFLAAGIFMCVTVYGEEIKSRNGIMTIETPDNTWKVTEAENSRTILTDGENVITMCHFSSGEKLPELPAAGEEYEQVCQNIVSTKDEIFVITGLAADAADFGKVQEAVRSAVINRYGTKKAVKKTEATEEGRNTDRENKEGEEYNTEHPETAEISGGYTVNPAAFTGWVDGSQVNVRSSCSTDSEIIGKVYFKNMVFVTAEVVNEDGNTEWYQIDCEGKTGYVYAAYISASPITEEQSEIELTEEHRMVYYTGGNGSAYISRASDGNWYDAFGRCYIYEGEGRWMSVKDSSVWVEEDMLPESAEINRSEEAESEETSASPELNAVDGGLGYTVDN